VQFVLAMSEAKFLDDYEEIDDFAKDVDRCRRSVERWTRQPDGLPFVRLGNRVLIHIPTAKAWLLARMHKPNRRRAGRAM
jgi:hypothetical protein